jgi:hypothetical protein
MGQDTVSRGSQTRNRRVAASIGEKQQLLLL